MSDKSISERTKALYEKTVAHMLRAYPELDLTDPDLVVEYLEAIGKKKSTIRVSICCLIQHHKAHTPDLDLTRFAEVYSDLSEEVKETYMKQTKEGKEHKSLEWPKILEAADKIQKDKDIPTEVKILVSLYTQLPPVRNDYIALKIRRKVPSKSTGNFILITSKVCLIVINEHKTAKDYGALDITVPDTIAEQIRAYLSENPDKTHLFNVSGSSISRWLGDAFVKHTGQRITANSLRHSYISEFRKGDKSLKDKMALARSMGHGLWLQELYREID